MDYKKLTADAETMARNIFQTEQFSELTYHNLKHTVFVVDTVKTMATHYSLDERSESLLIIAAWFHDIAYWENHGLNHERSSSRFCGNFLNQNTIPEADVEFVKNCILATALPQNPQTLEQQIICDADLSHFAEGNFYEMSKSLRKEKESVHGIKIKKEDWLAETISLMKEHQYFTEYARTNMQPQKEKNIQILEKKLIQAKAEDKIKDLSKDPTFPKAEKPSKGVETMFRITATNNQNLSEMADNKAGLLITVNSIILSAIISLLLRKLENNAYLSIPTYMILLVSVTSMLLSLLATRPNLPSGEFSEKEFNEKKVNLLFFGNFYKMNFEDYTKQMLIMMNDYDYLYLSLIRDVYSQGIVLSKKYKLLRLSYTIFMYGILLSVIAFIISSSLFADN